MLRITLGLSALAAIASASCGDDDDEALCDEAFEKWCACPDVSCEGSPASCTGPDREWAECILDAEDACQASCD